MTPADISPVPALFYVPLALAAIAIGSTIAAVVSGEFWVLGYVIYGLIAIFLVIIPSVLAYWFARRCPGPPCWPRSPAWSGAGARRPPSCWPGWRS
jgi:hypothetical protein